VWRWRWRRCGSGGGTWWHRGQARRCRNCARAPRCPPCRWRARPRKAATRRRAHPAPTPHWADCHTRARSGRGAPTLARGIPLPPPIPQGHGPQRRAPTTGLLCRASALAAGRRTTLSACTLLAAPCARARAGGQGIPPGLRAMHLPPAPPARAHLSVLGPVSLSPSLLWC